MSFANKIIVYFSKNKNRTGFKGVYPTMPERYKGHIHCKTLFLRLKFLLVLGQLTHSSALLLN